MSPVKKIFLLILIGHLLAACTQALLPAQATPITLPAGWDLIWHDEFDSKSINTSNWTYDLGGGGWGNGEMQVYTNEPENARAKNGLLVIEAHKETLEDGGIQFTLARLKTQGLQTFQYGRIEARIKVPEGKGFWPAFWMLGENFPVVGWPDCGEIDIMEYVGREPDLIIGTMHGPGYSGALGLSRWNRQSYNSADEFHTFAIEWDTNQISWFFDGEKYNTFTREVVGNRPWVFDQPFFIILNFAIGGSLGGLVTPDTQFPAQYLVDYVRAFEKIP